MKNYKKWIAVLLAVMVAAPAVFAGTALEKVPLYNDHPGSKKAQEKLNQEVLNLLKAGQFEKIDPLLKSVPKCPSGTVKKQDIPARCTFQLSDVGPFFLARVQTPTAKWRVTEDSATGENQVNLNIVVPEKALYYGLTKYYTHLFGKDPASFNANNYAAFYKRFSELNFPEEIRLTMCSGCLGESLAKRVEDTMIFIWQDGQEAKGWMDSFSGAKIYDAVYTATAMGVADPYKYVNGENFMSGSDHQKFLKAVQRIYGEMYTRALERKNKQIFYGIKTAWWNYILNNSRFTGENDCTWTIKLLAGDYFVGDATFRKTAAPDLAWQKLAITPITDWQKEQVAGLYKNCKEKLPNGPCEALRNNAIKHRYMQKSEQEEAGQVLEQIQKIKLMPL